MPSKRIQKNTEEVHENHRLPTSGADDLCECKRIRGLKFYENYKTWIPRSPEWEDLTADQKMGFIMASNNKRND